MSKRGSNTPSIRFNQEIELEKYGKLIVAAVTYEGEEPALLCTQSTKQYEEKYGYKPNFTIWRLVKIPLSELSEAGYSLPDLPQSDGDWENNGKFRENKRSRRHPDDELR